MAHSTFIDSVARYITDIEDKSSTDLSSVCIVVPTSLCAKILTEKIISQSSSPFIPSIIPISSLYADLRLISQCDIRMMCLLYGCTSLEKASLWEFSMIEKILQLQVANNIHHDDLCKIFENDKKVLDIISRSSNILARIAETGQIHPSGVYRTLTGQSYIHEFLGKTKISFHGFDFDNDAQKEFVESLQTTFPDKEVAYFQLNQHTSFTDSVSQKVDFIKCNSVGAKVANIYDLITKAGKDARVSFVTKNEDLARQVEILAVTQGIGVYSLHGISLVKKDEYALFKAIILMCTSRDNLDKTLIKDILLSPKNNFFSSDQKTTIRQSFRKSDKAVKKLSDLALPLESELRDKISDLNNHISAICDGETIRDKLEHHFGLFKLLSKNEENDMNSVFYEIKSSPFASQKVTSLKDYLGIIESLFSQRKNTSGDINSNVHILTPQEAKILDFDTCIIDSEMDVPDVDLLQSQIGKFLGKNPKQDAFHKYYRDIIHLINLIPKTVFTGGHININLKSVLLLHGVEINEVNASLTSSTDTRETFIATGKMPDKIYATWLDVMMDNPYQFYVQYVLGLRVSDNDFVSFSGSTKGNIIHQALEQSVINRDWEIDSIMNIIKAEAAKYSVDEYLNLMQITKLRQSLPQILDFLKGTSHLSQIPEKEMTTPMKEFILAAKFDLQIIDEANKKVTVIDYKTTESQSSQDSLIKNSEKCAKLQLQALHYIACKNFDGYNVTTKVIFTSNGDIVTLDCNINEFEKAIEENFAGVTEFPMKDGGYDQEKYKYYAR